MGVGFKELLLIAVIVMLVFGGKKLRTLGGDIAGFVKGLRSGLKDDETETADRAPVEDKGRVIDAHARTEHEKTPT